MGADDIPPHVAELVRVRVQSIARLEALLLLHRHATKRWTADAVARELRIDRDTARRALTALESHGLLVGGGRGHVYDSLQPSHGTVEDLARVYADRRVSLIAFLFEQEDSVESFADAFLLKEPKS